MQTESTTILEETVDETTALTDEFTFDLEELDGNRAMMFAVAPLDPIWCHC